MDRPETDVGCQSTKRGKPFIRANVFNNNALTCGERVPTGAAVWIRLEASQTLKRLFIESDACRDRKMAQLWVLKRQKTRFGRVGFNQCFQNCLKRRLRLGGDSQAHRQLVQSGKRLEMDGMLRRVHPIFQQAAGRRS